MANSKTIDLLLSTLELQPANWEVRLHIAELMKNEGLLEKAKEVLSEQLESAEDSHLLGAAELLAGVDSEAALDLLDKALTVNKANARVYLAKCKIYLERNDFVLAKTNYGIAAVIDDALEDPLLEAQIEAQNSQGTQMGVVEAGPQVVANAESELAVNSLTDEFANDFIETDSRVDALIENLEHVDFESVGGMEALKERIRMSIIHPFKHKELFAKFKKKTGGGILLYGPPGCGKTLISKATAGECGAHFINISIHDVLSKWVGESEQRIHQMFEVARRKAPTIIFIDELDALAVKRSNAGNSASLVNTLLTEIDGASSRNEDVLVLGATNTPWRIDSAFRRPGRFDHVLFVSPPDAAARESIFKLTLDGVPQEKINLKKLAKISDKFSGADIAAVVEKASEVVLHSIMTTGKESNLTEKQLVAAIKKHTPTTLEWLEQASNYASYANQAGLYDDLAEYMQGGS